MDAAMHHEDRRLLHDLFKKARYQMILKSVFRRLAIFGVEDCQKKKGRTSGAALTNLRTR